MNKRVLLFGAGDAGLRLFQILDSSYDVLAFVDNDLQKHGSVLFGKNIISAAAIAEYDYDFIIISNIHGESVRQQLTRDLNIPGSKVIDFYNQGLNDVRTASLKMAAREIYDAGLQGNVAELGVFEGDFARLINREFPDRNLYLFDTFEGFSKHDVKFDTTNNLSTSVAGEFCCREIETVLSKMFHRDKCFVKKGYFPQSASSIDESFVFVSIDVDLYRPTLEGLKFFYPKLANGGYIFVHDYNSNRFLGVKKAVREFCSHHNASYFPLHDISGSVVIGK